MKTLCIYHGNCADGFGAAWVVREALGEAHVEFYSGIYQRSPPDVTGRDVIMVDFSYKRPVLESMIHQAKSFLVLDHHKTAKEDLSFLNFPPPAQYWLENIQSTKGYAACAYFDIERSGAGLTWDFFFPGRPRPRLIDHIEDRDLWRFALPGTREIQACIFSYPYDFEKWTDLVDQCESDSGRADMVIEGLAIERKHFKDIRELLDVVVRPMKFRVGGQQFREGEKVQWFHEVVPVANLPYTMVSDAGHLMCEQDSSLPFAGCYYDGPDGRNFSLRSLKGKTDVSEIAKLYGGGGHANAAGFRVPFDQIGQFEP
jgi:uncharacterized protein